MVKPEYYVHVLFLKQCDLLFQELMSLDENDLLGQQLQHWLCMLKRGHGF
jgi:hypothetical protein